MLPPCGVLPLSPCGVLPLSPCGVLPLSPCGVLPLSTFGLRYGNLRIPCRSGMLALTRYVPESTLDRSCDDVCLHTIDVGSESVFFPDPSGFSFSSVHSVVEVGPERFRQLNNSPVDSERIARQFEELFGSPLRPELLGLDNPRSGSEGGADSADDGDGSGCPDPSGFASSGVNSVEEESCCNCQDCTGSGSVIPHVRKGGVFMRRNAQRQRSSFRRRADLLDFCNSVCYTNLRPDVAMSSPSRSMESSLPGKSKYSDSVNIIAAVHRSNTMQSSRARVASAAVVQAVIEESN